LSFAIRASQTTYFAAEFGGDFGLHCRQRSVAMKSLRLLTVLALLWGAVPIVSAQESEVHTADVCNSGELTLHIAYAYWEFNPLSFVNDPYWVVSRWVDVRPGDCERVFTHTYAREPLGLQHFPLHLAFAVTNSNGDLSPVEIDSWEGPESQGSDLELCVDEDDSTYRVDADDPASACDGNPGAFLIPASIDFEPTRGNYYDPVSNEIQDRTFTVGVSGNAHGGASGGRGTAPIGPGTTDELNALIRDATRAAPSHQDLPPAGYRDVIVCASRPVVERESLADPGTARAKALSEALRDYVARYPGKLFFEVTESGAGFDIQELIGEVSYCFGRGDRVSIYTVPEPDGH
jgi:hypothetical protein